MTNCPPVYRNLQCESFGNKRKVTSQMLRQLCKNDAYLYEQIMALWDTTDPESRKRFYPPYFMDVSKSFGIEEHTIDKYDESFFEYWSTVYRFSNIQRYVYTFDFNHSNDYMEIKKDGEDVYYMEINGDSYLDLENNYDEVNMEIINDGFTSLRPPLQTGSYQEVIKHKAQYSTSKKKIKQNVTKAKYVTQKKEKLGKAKKDAHFYGAFKNWDCNNHWYNAFNRTKNYNIKAKWKKDPDSYDIPSVCHAQTFKAQNTGRLSKVNLNIQGNKNAVSPCIVEIRSTKNGKPTTKVLARTEKKFTGSGENIVAFEFKTKAKVEKGKKYAIVVRSPLSNFEKCYRLGGWTTGCFSSESKYYGDGSAFLSEDNGKTWIKNGKTSDKKSYGSHYYDWGINQKPIDFAFEVFVQPITLTSVKVPVKQKTTQAKYVTEKKLVKNAYEEKHTYEYNYFKEGSYYIHLKPIQTNPIDNFIISNIYCNANGVEVNDGDAYWTWEYYDQYNSQWVEITNNPTDFNNNVTNYTVLKLRVRCDVDDNTLGGVISRDDVSNFDETIANELITTAQKLKETALTYLRETRLTINCRRPTRAYLRTHYYHPEKEDMLGASLWSEVGLKAKILKDSNAKLEIDVIHEKEAIDHFLFYDLSLIENYDTTNLNGVYSEKTVELFENMVSYIREYTGDENITFSDGMGVIDYVYNDYNNGKNFIQYLQNQLTPVYILPLYYLVNNVLTEIHFFETIQLQHLPSYPLVGGDVGDDDIVLDTSKITGKNESNNYVYYPLEKSISKTLNSIFVSYNIYTDVDTLTTETDDEELTIDEDGFEVNQLDSQERISETLNGIILQHSNVFTQSNYIKTNFVDNENGIESDIDYAITKDGMTIIFNCNSPIIQEIFPNWNNGDFTLATSIGTGADEENVSDFELKIDLISKAYQEFVDFEVDYDTGKLRFYNQSNIVDGDFKITYNPLWVRGLSVADFPLKMDLWKERYRVGIKTEGDTILQGVYKQKFNTITGRWVDGTFYPQTKINPLTEKDDTLGREFYTFKTTVPPLDNIRKLVLNEENEDGGTSLIEDTQFFVNYLSNTVTIYKSVENFSENDVLTIHYTPNLTDKGLALGYRITRPRYNQYGEIADADDLSNVINYQEDDVYIGMNYFTYRV